MAERENYQNFSGLRIEKLACHHCLVKDPRDLVELVCLEKMILEKLVGLVERLVDWAIAEESKGSAELVDLVQLMLEE